MKKVEYLCWGCHKPVCVIQHVQEGKVKSSKRASLCFTCLKKQRGRYRRVS